MLVGLLALLAAAVFAGAALYINVAEQPARMLLDDAPLLTQWKPSYNHGLVMQSSLAVVAFVLGSWAWWRSDDVAFLMGGLLMIANWPWTLLAILPTNRILMAIEPASGDPRIRPLLNRWNGLHAARTALSASACVAFLVALSG